MSEPRLTWVPDQESKTCTKCGKCKPLSEYSPNGFRKDGTPKKRPDCKKCVRDRVRAANNTIYWQRAHAKKRYGITLEEAEKLWYADSCYLCGSKDPKDARGKFHIDHDHETGAVRRPLCAPCNRGIGQFQDNPQLLRKAASYIEEFKCPTNR